eukprot:TRINITY_DN3408_c0_g1_i1.p1 TRINITY_DN3408_c0_g1~~TRINITY_DN3408_c0_g1_i1.p1  ORF type:complete len:550 (-),score=155.41 TRINITY_DN3408_c0_g1_i1:90-1739(-)
MKILLLFILIATALLSAHGQSANTNKIREDLLAKYQYCRAPISGFWVLWTFVPESSKVRFAISAGTVNPGYVAIGFNPNLSMLDGDLLIVNTPISGKPEAIDSYAKDREVCAGGQGVCSDTAFGGSNNVATKNSTFESNYLHVEFERPIIATDQFDKGLNETLYLFMASGERSGGSIQKHGWVWFENINMRDPSIKSEFPINNCVAQPTPTPTGPIFDPKFFNFSIDLSSTFKLYWRYVPGNDKIQFAYTLSANGWAGFGFSLDGSSKMVPGDAMVMTSFNFDVNVADYQLIDQTTGAAFDSVLGGTDDVKNKTTGWVNGQALATWSRLLKTGDKLDYVINPDQVTKCIYAFSNSKSGVSEHSKSESGQININFRTGEVSFLSDNRHVHGWLMWVAWGILVPIGSLIARAMKKSMGVWWFRIHIVLMVLAAALTIAGFGIIVDYKSSHFNNVHSRLGLAVFILAMIQPFIGVLADFMFDADRTKTPIFPDMVHWIIGWSTLILAFTNFWLGIDIYDAAKVFWILWGIHFGIFTVGLIIAVAASFFMEKN